MLTIEELVTDVKDLVPLPKSYLRIQELVNDPDSSQNEVTKVIMNDAGLTSRILRIANSAYLGLAAKVDTIGRAVNVLGLNQVHDTVHLLSMVLPRGPNPSVSMPVAELDAWLHTALHPHKNFRVGGTRRRWNIHQKVELIGYGRGLHSGVSLKLRQPVE